MHTVLESSERNSSLTSILQRWHAIFRISPIATTGVILAHYFLRFYWDNVQWGVWTTQYMT